MLHGVGGGRGGVGARSSTSFAAAGYRAVAWDAPGYGDDARDRAVRHGRPRALARAAARRDRRARACVLLGHSMGGMLAQEAVIAFPRKIAGLVLSATSPAFGRPDGALAAGVPRASGSARSTPGRRMADLAPALVGGHRRPGRGSRRRPARDRGHGARPRRRPTARRSHAIVGFDRRAALAVDRASRRSRSRASATRPRRPR